MKRYWYKFRVKYGKELGTGKKKKVSQGGAAGKGILTYVSDRLRNCY